MRNRLPKKQNTRELTWREGKITRFLPFLSQNWPPKMGPWIFVKDWWRKSTGFNKVWGSKHSVRLKTQPSWELWWIFSNLNCVPPFYNWQLLSILIMRMKLEIRYTISLDLGPFFLTFWQLSHLGMFGLYPLLYEMMAPGQHLRRFSPLPLGNQLWWTRPCVLSEIPNYCFTLWYHRGVDTESANTCT